MKAISNKVKAAEEGTKNALIIYAELKALLDETKAAVDAVQPLAMEEAEKHGEKAFEFKGFKFERRNGRATYSFKNIPEWNEKKLQLQEVEKRAKAALAAANKNILTATEDGEEVIFPEVSYSKDVLVVKSLK